LHPKKFTSAHILKQPVDSHHQSWRYYLDDQAMSPHTIKAFGGDLQLAGYLPRPPGDIATATW
jgi:hypothetical protein